MVTPARTAPRRLTFADGGTNIPFDYPLVLEQGVRREAAALAPAPLRQRAGKMWKTYLRTIHRGFQHYFEDGQDRPVCGRALRPEFLVTPMSEPLCQKCKDALER